ncbi:10350_t:CDS:2 [Ambispora gerdemannii]|uniref:Vacuolar ATPase assembly protein VMA22 n=1 Tax=Ambispora gerdemannii TaxID=144530 RepID=A0A9N8WQ71_9GLOM|nr:10350_t:CDS:2 [Ambispora gerdemannii]
MNSSEKLTEICEQLDTVVLEYLDLISSYKEQWKRISKELENGFLSLAHAKYAMGPSLLTQHQYDGRMKADTRVIISENQGAKANSFDNELGQSNNCQLILISGILDGPELDMLFAGDIAADTLEAGGLRQRNIKVSEKENNINMSENLEKHNYTKKRSIKNPLNWFGILVPSSLRESQNSFKQGLQEMINIINMRTKIHVKGQEYKKLKVEKELFLSSYHNINNDAIDAAATSKQEQVYPDASDLDLDG